MARINGLRKVGNGWKNNSLYGRTDRVRASQEPPETEEAKALRIARIEQQSADFVAAMTERMNSRGPKPIEKLIDREARVSVEGDTDLNHDNLEGGE